MKYVGWLVSNLRFTIYNLRFRIGNESRIEAQRHQLHELARIVSLNNEGTKTRRPLFAISCVLSRPFPSCQFVKFVSACSPSKSKIVNRESQITWWWIALTMSLRTLMSRYTQNQPRQTAI